jgi:hypothetical protein
MPCQSHPPWLDHSNCTWRSVQVMNLRGQPEFNVGETEVCFWKFPINFKELIENWRNLPPQNTLGIFVNVWKYYYYVYKNRPCKLLGPNIFSDFCP